MSISFPVKSTPSYKYIPKLPTPSEKHSLKVLRIYSINFRKFKMIIWFILVAAHFANANFFTVNRSATEQAIVDLEFSKDIASVLTEATLESNCDGSVIITTKGCADFMDYMLLQLSQWAPPVLLVTYQNYDKIGNSAFWATYLAWKRRPCSIIFVCDLMRSQYSLFGGGNMNDENTYEGANGGSGEDEIGHLRLSKFIESADQVLYLSDFIDENTNTSDPTRQDVPAKIRKQSGTLLHVLLENRTESEPEALMHVYAHCEYCGRLEKYHQRDLGYWQRNKTQFSRFFHIFDDFHKLSFNDTNLNIGYFNHPPHFSCVVDTVPDKGDYYNQSRVPEMITLCGGVEWEMITQMGKSLEFSVSWMNLSSTSEQQQPGEASNISNMIMSFDKETIDLGVGGISVTPKRIMFVDFSNVFTNDPIVFVVQKKSDLFALGIWLAFNPEIWPLILLLIVIISSLFHIIINQYTLEPPVPKNTRKKWALSTYIQRQFMEESRKPIHVAMFEAFEITLQPLLGQPLSATQITTRPRRLLKLLLTVWWFSCLIISTLYNTSLITSLINPISPIEPEALQDLLDFGYSFKPAGKQGAFFELIKSAMDELPVDQLTPDSATSDEMKTVRLIKQINERLVTDGSSPPTSLIAYVVEESAVKGIKWNQKEFGFSQIKVIRERLFLTTYAWPVQRHAPFKHKIDTALGRLNSAGLIEYWYQEFGHRDKEPKSGKFKLRQKLSQINVNMQVLQGAFIFLIFGHGVGAIILGVEHITKRYTFRFFTRKQIFDFFKMVYMHLRKVYVKYFATDQVDIQLRRHKNRMKFQGAVHTVTSFNKRRNNIPFMK